MLIKTPAWVVCGFLDAGKTTLLNRLLNAELVNESVLVIQFEAGESAIEPSERVAVLRFSKRRLEQEGAGLIGEIGSQLKARKVSLILIEWNGMAPFCEFEQLFLQVSAKQLLSVERVIYVANPKQLEMRLRDGGVVAGSQIAASDLALLRGKGRGEQAKAALLLQRYRKNLPVYTESRWKPFVRHVFRLRLSPFTRCLAGGLLLFIAVMLLLLASDFGFPVIRYTSVFLGVFLQAVPFLALGVLLSSAIQVFVSPDLIQRKFPKTLAAGQLFAVAAGFFLPVCDCASIPVFRSLVKKGVPLPSAVTFMLASPVINPVVLLSTWYAFGGNIRMVAARSGLGLLTALCVGLTYLIHAGNKKDGESVQESVLLAEGETAEYATNQPAFGSVHSEARTRFWLFLSHAEREFFSVGTYLAVGILVSTVFQNLLPTIVGTDETASSIWMLLVMMLLAFCLSLCSSSDAVVARTLGKNLPAGPILGFLVFGPMMDLKNIAMLLSGFRFSFVLRLLLTTFAVSFLILVLFILTGSGGILL